MHLSIKKIGLESDNASLVVDTDEQIAEQVEEQGNLDVTFATDAADAESNFTEITNQEEAAETTAVGLESMIFTLAKAIENDNITPEIVEMVENQTSRAVTELGGDETKFAIESSFNGTIQERAGIALENATSVFEQVIQAITLNTGRLIEGMQERYLGYRRVMQSVRQRSKSLTPQVTAACRNKDNGASIVLSDAGFGDQMLFDGGRCTDYLKAYQNDLILGSYIYGRFAKSVIGELSSLVSLFNGRSNFGDSDWVSQLANGLGKLTPADDLIENRYKDVKDAGFGSAGFHGNKRTLSKAKKKDLTMGNINMPVGTLRSPRGYGYCWYSNGYLHGSPEMELLGAALEIFEAQDITIKVSDLPKIANMNEDMLNINERAFDEMFTEFGKYKALIKNTIWKALAKPGAFGRIETIRLIWALDKIAKNYFSVAYDALIYDYNRRYRVVGNGNRMLKIAAKKVSALPSK
jgi:hypothetical protein